MYDQARAAEAACGLNRRAFLGAAVLLPWVGAFGRAGDEGTPRLAAPSTGMILRQRQPENLEFPFNRLDRFLTPNDSFYVRNHFAAPKLNAATWRLRVEGAVNQPLELSLDDLKKLPSRSETVTLECAGNGRVFLVPRENGVLWESGAVSTAEWTGIPLAAVLQRAGLKDAAVEVVLEGADSGTVADPKSPGVIPFARSLPLEKARKPEVLLAYQMNGQPLPHAHGFPVRAVVGGWYGMASVKWLTRIVVTDRPYHGYYQTLDYAVFEKRDGLPTLTPITEMQVKASIARPAVLEVMAANRTYRVHGAAWAGENQVARVDVSTDGGTSWQSAKLVDKPVAFAWRLWEYEWRAPKDPGRHTLMARAADDRGRSQPMERDPGRRNYMISHVLPIEVEVR
jgi:DMSO/TMAO reductase YedYZ molybdopterin-dependent catalytic subunit